MDVSTLVEFMPLAAVVGSAGAAWGAVKVSLNGTGKRLDNVAQELNKHVTDDVSIQRQIIDRLGSIEGKLDILTGR